MDPVSPNGQTPGRSTVDGAVDGGDSGTIAAAVLEMDERRRTEEPDNEPVIFADDLLPGVTAESMTLRQGLQVGGSATLIILVLLSFVGSAIERWAERPRSQHPRHPPREQWSDRLHRFVSRRVLGSWGPTNGLACRQIPPRPDHCVGELGIRRDVGRHRTCGKCVHALLDATRSRSIKGEHHLCAMVSHRRPVPHRGAGPHQRRVELRDAVSKCS